MAVKTPKKPAAPKAAAKKADKPAPKSARPFNERLVLEAWLFEKIGFDTFDDVREVLGVAGAEGTLDDGSMLRFTHFLLGRSRPADGLSDAELRRYDENIRRATQRIQGSRPPLVWKYFQYLSLLFTEIGRAHV